MKGRGKPKRHVTIREVARAAHASVSTVSAFLNDTDYVSAQMRARIEKAIRQLRYRPNHLARSLRLHRTHTIAIVVPDLLNSFYTEVVRGAKDHAEMANYTVLIGDSREHWAEEKTYLDEFHRRRVDGVIRIPAIDDLGGQADLVMGDVPVVYADRFPHAKDRNIGCVGVDNVLAAVDATKYLLSLRHRRIAIITGPPESKNSSDRLAGFRQAMLNAHIHVADDLIRIGDNGIVSGRREAMALLARARRPTAIFCTNNMMALGVLQSIQELKLRCPRDVSLLGFDDFHWATLLRPRLTMVHQPAREIGLTAARMLIEHIEARRQQPTMQYLPTRLLVRDSCAPPPTRNRPLPHKGRSAWRTGSDSRRTKGTE